MPTALPPEKQATVLATMSAKEQAAVLEAMSLLNDAKENVAFSCASPEGATEMWRNAGNKEDSRIIYTYGPVHVAAGSER